jgi:dethiobiotin synthetase/adenosylmethionine--8-amino-7-oxononanoate aminotransferase
MQIFVDPLFQQSLVRVVRRYNFSSSTELLTRGDDELAWSGLPVVFDEVFTGLYRLGRFTSSCFLDVHPDISVHAKLLTGGLLPLSVTIASASIFDAFWGDEKAEALLHGHSYTAHAVGCHVANTSLDTMEWASKGKEWKGFREQWVVGVNTGCWSMWSKDFVHGISMQDGVQYANALGSVLAVSLVDQGGSGKLC